MTYLEAAMDVIEMYNELAVSKACKGKSCGDHSESIALAIEALSIVAGMEDPKEKKVDNACGGNSAVIGYPQISGAATAPANPLIRISEG